MFNSFQLAGLSTGWFEETKPPHLQGNEDKRLCGERAVWGHYREGVTRVASTTATVTLQLLAADKHLTEQKSIRQCWAYLTLVLFISLAKC